MKQLGKQNNMLITAIAAVCLALAVFAVSLALVFSGARFVSEVDSGNTLPNETQNPVDIDSQTSLVNAIKSGYSYVKLNDDLNGPIIMSGDNLVLFHDLTIDLNGKEVQRTSTESLLTVSKNVTLSIIDTAKDGGGGLYNPVGSVLTVDGGDLNVYGGLLESGPRPSEYVTNLTSSVTSPTEVYPTRKVKIEAINGIEQTTLTTEDRTIFPIRSDGSGNVYFDEAVNLIERDTYCYVLVEGETNDDFNTFDKGSANFVYSYYVYAPDVEGHAVGSYAGCKGDKDSEGNDIDYERILPSIAT